MIALTLKDCLERYYNQKKFIPYMGEFIVIDDIQTDKLGNTWIWFGDYSRTIKFEDQIYIAEEQIAFAA